MIDQTFKRKETKYLISKDTRRIVEEGISEHLAINEFGRSIIMSVYFDTPDRLLISRSIEKPLYKEKIRIRTYGADEGKFLVFAMYFLSSGGIDDPSLSNILKNQGNIPVFLELKKKFRGIVYKRRLKTSLEVACRFLDTLDFQKAVEQSSHILEGKEEILSNKNIQIASEIAAAIKRYENLGPSMVVSYERVAYGSSNVNEESSFEARQDDLRITFDDRIRYCDYGDALIIKTDDKKDPKENDENPKTEDDVKEETDKTESKEEKEEKEDREEKEKDREEKEEREETKENVEDNGEYDEKSVEAMDREATNDVEKNDSESAEKIDSSSAYDVSLGDKIDNKMDALDNKVDEVEEKETLGENNPDHKESDSVLNNDKESEKTFADARESLEEKPKENEQEDTPRKATEIRFEWKDVIDQDMTVMEIKASKSYPEWLVDFLTQNKIYPSSFTKYGRAAQLQIGRKYF